MSFSKDVKDELCKKENNTRHCDIAEIAGIINTCGILYFNNSKPNFKIMINNPAVCKKFYKMIKKNFGVSCVISIRNNTQFKASRTYFLSVDKEKIAENILLSTGILTIDNGNYNLNKHLHPLVTKSVCCKKAYLRGCFIAGGSLSNPEKFYHLEFIYPSKILSDEMLKILSFFDLNAKMVNRKDNFVVYLKESENIADLLNVVEAHVSLLHFENIRVLKHVRNKVNRAVNCETANLSKTVGASMNHIESIKYIFETKGSDYLSEQLSDVAYLRLEHPEASLKEIGVMLCPQISKSGVNHRLKKICNIANNLRGDLL